MLEETKRTTVDIHLAEEELKILEFWKERGIFKKSLEARAECPTFTFYDGPPFATGLPHYGHILAGVIKDIVPRYWTMKGFRVPRRFGWDCHGVPVEFEINKSLGLSSRKDVLEYGVGRYNEACRGIVSRYSSEWRKTVERVGRWVDMDHAYFTMDKSFMQSVWWVFKSLHENGLVYRGHKVVPYSPAISTSLSNFEANLNYREVTETSVTAFFPLKENPERGFLAWTTTPWTLPANVALAVHPNLIYCEIREKTGARRFWVVLEYAERLVAESSDRFEITQRTAGHALKGLEYVPCFSDDQEMSDKTSFKVVESDHVNADSGTGIVHIAPAYGEDDFEIGIRENLPLIHLLDDDGRFVAGPAKLRGLKFSEANAPILSMLSVSGLLFRQERFTHSYPFCYRSQEPLIYRAISSWFVNVEKIKDLIVAANGEVNWIPEYIRDGRFGHWLADAKDWSISRSRFWGTPIPIWTNPEGEMICVGSAQELEALTGLKIDDLHKDRIDHLQIPSPTGKSPLIRVEDVFDCWFESGSMPFAQRGYPFASADRIEDFYPADFIAEGLDQTRGWFYTLLVIGVALTGRPPYKNVNVNGLVLAEDGKKMSKSLKNYPDPTHILEQYGADALRLYLINSPVLKAEEMRFSETGVREIARRVLLRWWNASRFFVTYSDSTNVSSGRTPTSVVNPFDRYIQSKLNRLIVEMRREMDAYRLFNVVPELLRFIEDLTNIYIRYNRLVLWDDESPAEQAESLHVLRDVLLTFCKCMAPFAPFLAETIYRGLSDSSSPESVHLADFPEAQPSKIDAAAERTIERMDYVSMTIRNFRERRRIPVRIPLQSLLIASPDPEFLDDIRKVERFLREETNVQEIHYSSDEKGTVDIVIKPNYAKLGKRAGPLMKKVASALQNLDASELAALRSGEELTIEGVAITSADVDIVRRGVSDDPGLVIAQSFSLRISDQVTEDQIRAGTARRLTRAIQAARKAAKLQMNDRIHLGLKLPEHVRTAAETHSDSILKDTRALSIKYMPLDSLQYSQSVDFNDEVIGIEIRREGD